MYREWMGELYALNPSEKTFKDLKPYIQEPMKSHGEEVRTSYILFP